MTSGGEVSQLDSLGPVFLWRMGRLGRAIAHVERQAVANTRKRILFRAASNRAYRESPHR